MTNLFLEFFFISLFSRKIEMEWKMHDRKTNVIDFSGIVLILSSQSTVISVDGKNNTLVFMVKTFPYFSTFVQL